LNLEAIVLGVVLVLLIAPAATAQVNGERRGWGEGIGVTGILQWSSPGIALDVSKERATVLNVRTINVVAEINRVQGRTHDDTNIMGGLRWVRHNESHPVLFAQLLAGTNHEDRGNEGTRDDFRIQPGGGAIFPIGSPRVRLKVQNDYPIIPMSSKTTLYLRFAVGVEIHLGEAGK